MKKNTKLFAFDLDGTFLTEKDNYHNESAQAIERIKKAGHIPIIVTGRPLYSTKKIKDLENMFDHIIVNDGAFAYNSKTKYTHWDKQINGGLIRSVIDIAKTHQSFVWIHQYEKTYRFKSTKEILAIEKRGIKSGWFTKSDVQPISNFNKNTQIDNAYELLIWSKDSCTDELIQSIKALPFKLSLFHNKPHYAIISPKKTSKYYGVKSMAKLLNIKQKNIYVFGDGINDISMLSKFDNSYAMGNAIDEVKKCSKNVIGTNKEMTIPQIVDQILKTP